MGTDIHLFLEHKIGGGEEYFSLAKGELNLPRDYDVFAALAGVRTDAAPLIPPRGFPSDASWDAHRSYYHRVSDDETQYHDGLWWIEKSEHAESYVARGISHRKLWRNVDLVSDPDAHHPSWLAGTEFSAALRASSLDLDKLSSEYLVVIAALDLFATRHARVVFWFDN